MFVSPLVIVCRELGGNLAQGFVCDIQVPLMEVVPSVVAALDANPGDATVACSGLDFLDCLAKTEENQVALR